MKEVKRANWCRVIRHSPLRLLKRTMKETIKTKKITVPQLIHHLYSNKYMESHPRSCREEEAVKVLKEIAGDNIILIGDRHFANKNFLYKLKKMEKPEDARLKSLRQNYLLLTPNARKIEYLQMAICLIFTHLTTQCYLISTSSLHRLIRA